MAHHAKAAGGKLGLYPEGTRPPDPRLLHKLHKRILIPLLRDNPDVPAHAVTIRHSDRDRLGRRIVEVRFSERLELDPAVVRPDDVVAQIRDRLLQLGGQTSVDRYAGQVNAERPAARQVRPFMSGRVVPCPGCQRKNRVPVAGRGSVRCAHCGTALPWIVDAGDAELAAALDNSQLVLIDLWAPWCAPCRMVAPVLERLALRYAGRVKVVKVNVDDNPATAARYDARSIPTLVLVRDGQPVGRLVGAQPEPVLTREIERALAGG